MSGGITPHPERAALNQAMDRYADGDAAAFTEVYDRLAPRLLGFFVRRVRDQALAEDLVQQTLLRMHLARRNYVSGSDVVPWAFAIGHNLMRDALRRSRREVLFRTAEQDAAALDGRVARDSRPDELASARQSLGRIRDELGRVPRHQREAYDLVRQDGLSVAAAALVMGATPMAIKLRVHRVYEALRAALARDDRAEI